LGRVLPAFPRAKVAIIGPDQGYLGNLKELSAKLNLDGSVIFTGQVSSLEKRQFLCATKVGVVLSLYEASPLTALEFMACGKPIIASSVGGLRDAIAHGHNGMLVNNDRDEIATALLDLLSDADKAREMGQNGLRRARSAYSWEKVIDRLEEVYRACAPNRE
jgi:glycosyltransferase involved in cell wall biosynthesis